MSSYENGYALLLSTIIIDLVLVLFMKALAQRPLFVFRIRFFQDGNAFLKH